MSHLCDCYIIFVSLLLCFAMGSVLCCEPVLTEHEVLSVGPRSTSLGLGVGLFTSTVQSCWGGLINITVCAPENTV